jgi:hypothetical protein
LLQDTAAVVSFFGYFTSHILTSIGACVVSQDSDEEDEAADLSSTKYVTTPATSRPGSPRTARTDQPRVESTSKTALEWFRPTLYPPNKNRGRLGLWFG